MAVEVETMTEHLSLIRTRPRAISSLILLLALAGAAVGLRAVLGASRGLSAEYFAGDQWDAPRAIQLVTPEISTARIAADWGGPPPPTFRAR